MACGTVPRSNHPSRSCIPTRFRPREPANDKRYPTFVVRSAVTNGSTPTAFSAPHAGAGQTPLREPLLDVRPAPAACVKEGISCHGSTCNGVRAVVCRERHLADSEEAAVGPSRTFAAAFLGHKVYGGGDVECNFRVTHLPTGTSWSVRRHLREWQQLEDQLASESEDGQCNQSQTPEAASRIAGRSSLQIPVENFKHHPQHSLGIGSHAPSGMEVLQFEQLQAKLAEMLYDERLQTSVVLHRFLGIVPPDVPSLVRIAQLQADVPASWSENGGSALVKATIEVHIQDHLLDDSLQGHLLEQSKLPTHIVATVNALCLTNRKDERHLYVANHVAILANPTRIVVGGLRPGIAYEFDVQTKNAVGYSESVRIHVLIPQIAVPDEPTLPSPPAPSPLLAPAAAPPSPARGKKPSMNEPGDAGALNRSASKPEFMEQRRQLSEASSTSLPSSAMPESNPNLNLDDPTQADSHTPVGFNECAGEVEANTSEAAIVTEACGGPIEEGRALVVATHTRRPLPIEGHTCVGTFNVRIEQLPEDIGVVDVDALVAQLRTNCMQVTDLSEQEAIRLLMGCNFDLQVAQNRERDIIAWRQRLGMANIYEQFKAQLDLSSGTAAQPIYMPHQKEVCKLVVVNPFALTSADGCPISIWHVGTANGGAVSQIEDEVLMTWSRNVFEYANLWISEQSEKTRQLVGHIQIFNVKGLGLRHVSNRALLEKLKIALGAGAYYVEAVSHIYVINSSSLFSMAWTVIRSFVSARTQLKITVDNGVPDDLLKKLDPGSQSRLLALLEQPRFTPMVLRPPQLPLPP